MSCWASSRPTRDAGGSGRLGLAARVRFSERSLRHCWQKDSARVVLEINRSILFVKQQFGADVRSICFFGPGAEQQSEMMAAGELALRRLAVGGRDEQFVGPEIVGLAAADGNLEYIEQGRIEAPAGVEIGNDEPDVIDQTSAVK